MKQWAARMAQPVIANEPESGHLKHPILGPVQKPAIGPAAADRSSQVGSLRGP